ncbi:TetR/AcrR family transcriptional regulator [Nonomuraea sp. K274]|uniref:TetR/AcrR family transcriptional regulator n=1 Tax=Nonomuraea cypriaca TaxID=1187855 RepID=A0A931A6J0_9ACTN|nr:TetR/AcrR family transcriptional regulator [Nonomuraea cypriaca]MBF8187171.1 TetR/AcrR family transcriptional regulator [Nonomuraea cypriaca]
METHGRRVAGAALLRERVTEVITAAVLDELADTGYARMSMEAVARRAGVGKAALYRRWPSKEVMVQQIVDTLAGNAVPIPDTGNLREDVSGYVAHAAALRNDLRTTRIIADLSAEAIRNPQLAQSFSAALREPRRAAGTTMLHHAMERGELPADLDTDLALDCLVALTHARPQTLTASGELAAPYSHDRLVEVILVALAACRR